MSIMKKVPAKSVYQSSCPWRQVVVTQLCLFQYKSFDSETLVQSDISTQCNMYTFGSRVYLDRPTVLVYSCLVTGATVALERLLNLV